jgi:hypothetical protein
MEKYQREYPLFSLCGLNCGLCPRYQTKGQSKCPGCGGEDFHLKHPACTVINCSRKHDNAEYCFQCSSFPCERYRRLGNIDSFISYRNVMADFEKASRDGLEQYKIELNGKVAILEFLLNNFNDGKRKNYYCIAVNLFNLTDLRDIMIETKEKVSPQNISLKEKITVIVNLFEAKAKKENIILKLRK